MSPVLAQPLCENEYSRFLSLDRYFHRSLNPKKLVETGFSGLARNSTMAKLIKQMRVPEVHYILIIQFHVTYEILSFVNRHPRLLDSAN
jgi:hypothetical protein